MGGDARRTDARVQPQALQVLRELAQHVPRLALASRRTAERALQGREHRPRRPFGFGIVREHGAMAHAAEELDATDMVRVASDVADAPEPLESRRELRFDVAPFRRGQSIPELSEYDERHPLGAALVAAERCGHFTEEGSAMKARYVRIALLVGSLMALAVALGAPQKG